MLLSGYFNYFLIIFFILLIHDLGHIITLKYFNYNVSSIIILPFGSILNSNLKQNSKSLEIFIISISGVLAQIMLYPIMHFLNQIYISDLSYNIFLNYNKIILLFNLLPIIPLDGSKIMLSVLENFFSYKKTLKIINIISIITIILFSIYITLYSLNSFLIIMFLIYKTWFEIKNHKVLFNNFLLSRALSKNNNKKIKYIPNIKYIFKNKFNFINNTGENKVLKALYRINN